jgi:cytochrome d ubiquinol oxidase subunit II
MGLPELVAGIILAVLIVYVLMGGADFGGGVWDLLAVGPRAPRQRETIAHAIGPVWEANHVWMIVAVVLLFTAFPPAFAAIMTGLHIPISIMLLGIVLRGSSFVFRKVDDAIDEGVASKWQLVFAISSLITPVMIGVVMGTLSTPALQYRDGVVHGGFLDPWLRPFPWAVGAFTLALFAWLAASYLTMEAEGEALREDFRRRALAAGIAVALTGAAAGLLWERVAPDSMGSLTGSLWSLADVEAGGVAWLVAMVAMWRRRWRGARLAAALTAVLVLVGWGVGQYPWLVPDGLTIRDAAAPEVTLRLVSWILLGGGVVLVPAFAYLYLTFKGSILLPRGGMPWGGDGDRPAP